MDRADQGMICIVAIFLNILNVVSGFTNQNDFKILNDFKNGLSNPELLKWPSNGNDPCGPPAWPHVFCSGGRVTQIQVQGMGLNGTLPQNLNQLDKLFNVGLQKNNFMGKLPTFSGLSNLQFAYLDNNNFDTIPSDFFDGLSSIRVLALDQNPFNASSGWSIPEELQDSAQLTNFSCSSCNIVGNLPDFFGKLPSLSVLKLSYNRLSGPIPATLGGSNLQILQLNDQDGGGMTGPIDVLGTMLGLVQVWLHGNQLTGSIPDNIGDLTSLRDLNLNGNHLVGLIPQGLADMSLVSLNLNNNMFMGPIPKFNTPNASFSSNSFCQPRPGDLCAPDVNALLDFLHGLNYPAKLASEWTGNDPCEGPWWGITCNAKGEVSVINLQKLNMNGTLSSSLVNLGSLLEIHLPGNNLHGPVPANLTQLKSLRLLDISNNNFDAPLPKFPNGVKVITSGNPQLSPGSPKGSSPPTGGPLPPSPSSSPLPGPPSDIPPSGDDKPPSSHSPPSPAGTPKSKSHTSPSPAGTLNSPSSKSSSGYNKIVIAAAAASVILALMVFLAFYCVKKKKNDERTTGIVVHPRDPSQPDDMVKITVSNESIVHPKTGSSLESKYSFGLDNAYMIEDGGLMISGQILCEVTDNFAKENELGRGGFGAVYKGVLQDGTQIAVKRMENGAISSKALDEFRAEIAVLSKVRHRHLVSLLGYSVEGNEKLLVYEYMPQGALSRHLFRWKSLNLQPLSWTRRLTIALDVARGVEYLHSLAHRSFIHRDLKSANILLDDAFRAKVADFGLVKLAPDRERSVATRLAGTFGYLAPEYAGKDLCRFLFSSFILFCFGF